VVGSEVARLRQIVVCFAGVAHAHLQHAQPEVVLEAVGVGGAPLLEHRLVRGELPQGDEAGVRSGGIRRPAGGAVGPLQLERDPEAVGRQPGGLLQLDDRGGGLPLLQVDASERQARPSVERVERQRARQVRLGARQVVRCRRLVQPAGAQQHERLGVLRLRLQHALQHGTRFRVGVGIGEGVGEHELQVGVIGAEARQAAEVGEAPLLLPDLGEHHGGDRQGGNALGRAAQLRLRLAVGAHLVPRVQERARQAACDVGLGRRHLAQAAEGHGRVRPALTGEVILAEQLIGGRAAAVQA
jgi:hypothetical protein